MPCSPTQCTLHPKATVPSQSHLVREQYHKTRRTPVHATPRLSKPLRFSHFVCVSVSVPTAFLSLVLEIARLKDLESFRMRHIHLPPHTHIKLSASCPEPTARCRRSALDTAQRITSNATEHECDLQTGSFSINFMHASYGRRAV